MIMSSVMKQGDGRGGALWFESRVVVMILMSGAGVRRDDAQVQCGDGRD